MGFFFTDFSTNSCLVPTGLLRRFSVRGTDFCFGFLLAEAGIFEFFNDLGIRSIWARVSAPGCAER